MEPIYYKIDNLFPVGSIYLTIGNTNPSTFLGGTWEQIKDRFLLGAGNTYTAGNTGGEATHTLTINELPPHNHGFKGYTSFGQGTGAGFRVYGTDGGADYSTFNTGSEQAHNNMPPYLTVYMWKRTA